MDSSRLCLCLFPCDPAVYPYYVTVINLSNELQVYILSSMSLYSNSPNRWSWSWGSLTQEAWKFFFSAGYFIHSPFFQMKYQDHLNLNQPILYPKIKREEWEKMLSYIQSLTNLINIYKEMANTITINSLIGAGSRQNKVWGNNYSKLCLYARYKLKNILGEEE